MLARLKLRLLPLLIGLGVIIVGLRGADLVSRLVVGTAIEPVATAQAQTAQTQPAQAPAAPASATPSPTAQTPPPKSDAQPTPAQAATPSTVASAAAPAAAPTTPERHALPEPSFSPAEMELLQNLSKRREELDQRDTGIQQREAVLKVTEDRVNQKIAELNTLKADLEKLLDVQKKKQDDQVMSLVKIYSDMKAPDAARIFNTLEMPVLLSVVSKMKEQKSAAIISAMQPDRARELTTRLADLRELPQGAAPSPGPTGAPTALSPAAAAAAAAVPAAPAAKPAS